MKRREWLLYGGLAAGSLGIVGTLINVLLKFLWPPQELLKKEKETGKVMFNVDEIPEGIGKKFSYKGRPYILIKKGNEFYVLSAVCTHLGCLVDYDAGSNTLQCPCHGAIFSLNGSVLKGPAPSPLNLLPVKVEDNKVIIGEG
jgi:cytochrome b6-f complex iron-sulfur subunit